MACDSGLFGIYGPDSGWFSNVQMAKRYASLVTPARSTASPMHTVGI